MHRKSCSDHGHEHRIQNILKNFRKAYSNFRLSYRIISGKSIEEISRKNGYASLIRSINKATPENNLHRVAPDDIDRFNRSERILQGYKYSRPVPIEKLRDFLPKVG